MPGCAAFVCATSAKSRWWPMDNRSALMSRVVCIYALHSCRWTVGSESGGSGWGWRNRAMCYLQLEETVHVLGEKHGRSEAERTSDFV